VAAALAAFVCELPLASPLGGGVMVAWHQGQDPVAVDFFTRTPGLGLESRPELDFDHVNVDFGSTIQVFHVGRASAAIPLALPGVVGVHRDWGRLPLPVVAEPAVELARRGYVLGEQVAYVFWLLVPIVTRSAECQALYFQGDRVATAGSRLDNPALGDTLEAVAKDPRCIRELYQQLVREFSPAAGGLMTPADVERLDIARPSPLRVDHSGLMLATMPPPSSGGVLVALGLKLLEGIGARGPFLGTGHLLGLAQVQDALLSVRDSEFDRRCREDDFVRGLLAPERVARLRARLGAHPVTNPGNALGSTTHISTLDEEGNAVAVTLSNGEGCGYVLRGTGMVVNNMLGEQDLHPRGFHRDPPGTLLSTMMAPTIARGPSNLWALGSGGSNRLRTAILSVTSHLIDHGVSAAEAVRAPRIHLEPIVDRASPAGGCQRSLAYEVTGLESSARQALLAAYPDSPVAFERPNIYFGGVHVAEYADGHFSGAGDPRRGGAVSVVE